MNFYKLVVVNLQTVHLRMVSYSNRCCVYKLITNLLILFNQRQVVTLYLICAEYNVFILHFLDIKHHEVVKEKCP